jgi:hypothetical protein
MRKVDNSPKKAERLEATTPVNTTLYDLVSAIGDEVPSGEDRLVASIVFHLFENGTARFQRDAEELAA